MVSYIFPPLCSKVQQRKRNWTHPQILASYKDIRFWSSLLRWRFWSCANQLTVCRNREGGNSHLIVFRLTVRLKGRGKKKSTKTSTVCGPSKPVVWYTAPLKLTAVFIVALEISLVKLQAWPVNQGCLAPSRPLATQKNPRLRHSYDSVWRS